MDLKIKDSKLLISLFENSKISNRQLAKKIGVSKETVASRIEYFEKLNIIKSFSVKTNYEKLGFKEFTLYIRLKNVDMKQINKLIKYLDIHSNTTWIGKTFGKYDLRVSIIVKEYYQINEIITQIQADFGKNIEEIESLYVVDKFKASEPLFLENIFGKQLVNQTLEKPKNLNIKSELTLLDEIDKKLLYHLSQDPKQTYSELTKIVKLTPEAIKYRISRLENNQFITGYGIVLDGAKFEKIWCTVLLRISPDKLKELKGFLKGQRFLSNYTETIGTCNLTASFFANNIEELYTSLNVVRNKFSENIQNFEFLITFEVEKFPRLPTCILE